MSYDTSTTAGTTVRRRATRVPRPSNRSGLPNFFRKSPTPDHVPPVHADIVSARQRLAEVAAAAASMRSMQWCTNARA